jgi:hypothetical protein
MMTALVTIGSSVPVIVAEWMELYLDHVLFVAAWLLFYCAETIKFVRTIIRKVSTKALCVRAKPSSC